MLTLYDVDVFTTCAPRSGTPLRSGHGTSSWITVPSVGTTSWIYVSLKWLQSHSNPDRHSYCVHWKTELKISIFVVRFKFMIHSSQAAFWWVSPLPLRHRVPGQSGLCNVRGVHRGLGGLQRKTTAASLPITDSFPLDRFWRCFLFSATACVPLPLYLPLAEDQTGVSTGQQRVGVPEVSV